jgi:DNA-binding beta-propeller fold protein YncE
VVGSIALPRVDDPGLAYDPDTDTLYLSEEDSDQVYTLDLQNGGAASPLPQKLGFDLNNSGLAWLDGRLYGVSHDHPISMDTARLFEVDLVTGTAVSVVEMIGTQFTGLAADESMGVLYVTDTVNDQLYVIDPLAATIVPVQMPNPIGTTNVEGLAMKYVPEPSLGLLLLSGAFGLAGLASRRR